MFNKFLITFTCSCFLWNPAFSEGVQINRNHLAGATGVVGGSLATALTTASRRESIRKLHEVTDFANPHGKVFNDRLQQSVLKKMESGSEVTIRYHLSPIHSKRHRIVALNEELTNAYLRLNDSAFPNVSDPEVAMARRIDAHQMPGRIEKLEKQIAKLRGTPLSQIEPVEVSKTIKIGDEGPMDVKRFIRKTRMQYRAITKITRVTPRGMKRLKGNKFMKHAGRGALAAAPAAIAYGALQERRSRRLRQSAEERISSEISDASQ